MATYRQFVVADVQSIGGGYSFSVVSQAKRPLFTVVYRTQAEAKDAQDAMERLLANAIEVTSRG